jgi:Rieske Fe-S protein
MDEDKVTRRELLYRSLKTVVASAVVPVLMSLKGRANAEGSEKKKPNTSMIELDLNDDRYTKLRSKGGAVYINLGDKAGSAIVHRISDSEVAVFSSRCTHAGCKVELPEKDRIVCKCHNSVFDGRGRRKSGPASRDLKQFNAKLEKDSIVITVS